MAQRILTLVSSRIRCRSIAHPKSVSRQFDCAIHGVTFKVYPSIHPIHLWPPLPDQSHEGCIAQQILTLVCSRIRCLSIAHPKSVSRQFDCAIHGVTFKVYPSIHPIHLWPPLPDQSHDRCTAKQILTLVCSRIRCLSIAHPKTGSRVLLTGKCKALHSKVYPTHTPHSSLASNA
jgi:hypothetical protein